MRAKVTHGILSCFSAALQEEELNHHEMDFKMF